MLELGDWGIKINIISSIPKFLKRAIYFATLNDKL